MEIPRSLGATSFMRLPSIKRSPEVIWGCGQILGPGMTGRDKNVIY